MMPTAAVAAQNPEFVKVMGRVVAERLIGRIARQHFQPMLERFFGALRRSLPDLPEEELQWRVHFMFGAMAHTFSGQPELWPEGMEPQECDFRERMEKLVAFLSAGFQARPVVKPVEVKR